MGAGGLHEPSVLIDAWGERPRRRYFAQCRSGVQVDLVAIPTGSRRGLPHGAMALYDPDGRLTERIASSVEGASAEDVRTWAFLGWAALADLDKYLRRGSPWEALERLQEAWTHGWRLWAVACGRPYPAFGMTTALDAPGAGEPARIGETVATMGVSDLECAGLVLGAVLDDVAARAAVAAGATLPTGKAAFVLGRLREGLQG